MAWCLPCYFMLFAADSTFSAWSLLLHDLRGDQGHFAAQDFERLIDVAQRGTKISFPFYAYTEPEVGHGSPPAEKLLAMAKVF